MRETVGTRGWETIEFSARPRRRAYGIARILSVSPQYKKHATLKRVACFLLIIDDARQAATFPLFAIKSQPDRAPFSRPFTDCASRLGRCRRRSSFRSSCSGRTGRASGSGRTRSTSLTGCFRRRLVMAMMPAMTCPVMLSPFFLPLGGCAFGCFRCRHRRRRLRRRSSRCSRRASRSGGASRASCTSVTGSARGLRERRHRQCAHEQRRGQNRNSTLHNLLLSVPLTVRSRTFPHFVNANAVPSGARTQTQSEYG